MNANRLKKIIIVGGGTSGWMVAAAMSRVIGKQLCEVELIESDDIGIVGVGEATIPPIVDFIKFLGIDEAEFLKETSATYKVAIKFQDWHTLGESYYHPFGSVGATIDNKAFHSCWLRARSCGDRSIYTDYSPAVTMSKSNKFYSPHMMSKGSLLAGANYAWHFDASLVAKFLRKYAIGRGVIRTEGIVTNVVQKENEFINKLILSDGRALEADFFIDCSGFKGFLIEQTLKSGYQDWINFLPCDRAITVPTERASPLFPYTISHAREAGWTWQVPLQYRTGNGYVYSSKFCSDEDAKKTLLNAVEGTVLGEPKVIKFTTGYRKKMWNKNCLSLGLAAGFLEPLESTAIHLVIHGLRTFLELLPDKNCDEQLSNEYNRIMIDLYENVRDFIVLHYCTTAREDTAFWRWCRNMPIPHKLMQKIDLYKTQGRLYHNPEDLFKAPSWLSVFEGMGIHPSKYDPLVDHIDEAGMKDILVKMKTMMHEMAINLPSHEQYIDDLLGQEYGGSLSG